MFNVGGNINYWKNTAESNIVTAGILIENTRLVEGLFFCHLCIEKILKALVVKEIKTVPPKSHDLEYLARKAGISVSEEQFVMMRILMKYMLEGRYPEYFPKTPSKQKTKEYYNKTKELLICLTKKL
jgi:HEPN domain-containing protein